MILVTLGTHGQPMDRLVMALDEIAESGEVEDEILITAAAYARRPVRAKPLGIQPYGQLVAWANSARAIITHGGPASIALAFASGHSPIIVPRDPAFGEHVDDHQIRFTSWLAARRDLIVVLDMKDLGHALKEAVHRHETEPMSPEGSAEAIARLREIVTSGHSPSSSAPR